jgi:ubiquinone/menaquinone biosynthesis C-methylase UbiE
MKEIESHNPKVHTGLTCEIRNFWTRHVNAERIYGKTVSTHERGNEQYFSDLEQQRYRSHRHLLPWINTMTPGKTVLEIGSGIGLDSYTMAKLGLVVTAVDLTQVAARTASQRFARNAIAGQFAVADAGHLPFPENTYDYVYSFGVLHHAADTAQTIHEVHRALKQGGEARIMLYHRHSLNEFVHRLVRVPFEEKDALCPVVRRYTTTEVRDLFRDFSSVHVHLDHLFGEGYGMLYRLTPRWLYSLLSRHLGWHIMISATK